MDRRRPRWRLPLFLFVATAVLAAFFTGMYVRHAEVFPFPLVRSAYRTLVTSTAVAVDDGIVSADCAPVAGKFLTELQRSFHVPELICPAAHVARGGAAAARVEFLAGDALEDPVLMKGEVGTFLDQCPGPWGCLAVEYSRSGSVRRAWPFRPEEIVAANVVAESDPPGLSFLHDVKFFQLSLYPDGDLLVVFTIDRFSPGGVARIAPDGRPRWYRKGYSHHWPHVVDEDLALVPGRRRDRTILSYAVGTSRLALRCRDPIWDEQVNVIDGRGRLLEEIPILDAIVQSPHAGSLVDANGCNPIHLNYVSVLGADAGGAAGIAPGDLVVSLRNLNAFGILDRDDRRLNGSCGAASSGSTASAIWRRRGSCCSTTWAPPAPGGLPGCSWSISPPARRPPSFPTTPRRATCGTSSRVSEGNSTFRPTGAASCSSTACAGRPSRFVLRTAKS